MEKIEFSFKDYTCYNLDSKNCDEDEDLKTKVYFINENNMYIKEEDFENTNINCFINNYNEFQNQKITNDILNNKIYSFSNASTGDETEKKNNLIIEETKELENKVEEKKELQNIFVVNVEKLKLKGRKKKSKKDESKNNLNEVIKSKNKKQQKCHSKIDKDNLIRKVRIYLIKFAKDLLNDCIKKEFGTKKIQQIKGVVQELTSDITISFNIEFFNSTLERIFSNPLNKKYKKMDEAHNINEIKKIKQNINKASLTNELLNKTLLEVYDWFIQKDNYEYFYDRYGKGENTYNLKEFLNTLKNKESDDYIKELEKEGMKLIESFKPTKARKVKKKRKIKFKGTNFEGYY